MTGARLYFIKLSKVLHSLAVTFAKRYVKAAWRINVYTTALPENILITLWIFLSQKYSPPLEKNLHFYVNSNPIDFSEEVWPEYPGQIGLNHFTEHRLFVRLKIFKCFWIISLGIFLTMTLQFYEDYKHFQVLIHYYKYKIRMQTISRFYLLRY